jgi:hypothetical protein
LLALVLDPFKLRLLLAFVLLFLANPFESMRIL